MKIDLIKDLQVHEFVKTLNKDQVRKFRDIVEKFDNPALSKSDAKDLCRQSLLVDFMGAVMCGALEPKSGEAMELIQGVLTHYKWMIGDEDVPDGFEPASERLREKYSGARQQLMDKIESYHNLRSSVLDRIRPVIDRITEEHGGQKCECPACLESRRNK